MKIEIMFKNGEQIIVDNPKIIEFIRQSIVNKVSIPMTIVDENDLSIIFFMRMEEVILIRKSN